MNGYYLDFDYYVEYITPTEMSKRMHDKIDWRRDAPNIGLSHSKNPMWKPRSQEDYEKYLDREAVMCAEYRKTHPWMKQEGTLFSLSTWLRAECLLVDVAA